jgi:hypothetical protein
MTASIPRFAGFAAKWIVFRSADPGTGFETGHCDGGLARNGA